MASDEIDLINEWHKLITYAKSFFSHQLQIIYEYEIMKSGGSIIFN